MRAESSEFWKQWEGEVADGKFPLRQYLGGGDTSAVFLTEYGPKRQRGAIKLVKADPRTADLQVSRWQATSKLSHPHLMRLFTAGRCELGGQALLYVVMEYAEEDLSQVLPHRPLTAVEARDMLDPALSALGYLHTQGFVHGHLKPSNIMAVDDQLRISSDGLRRIGESDDRSPHSIYDPPEAGTATASAAGDVWSLGVTLVEILTQRLPDWTREEPAEPILPEALGDPFLEIARHCLQPNPGNRWTPAEISALLRPAGSRELRKAPTRLRLIVPAAVVALAAVVILVARGMQSKPSSLGAAPVTQTEQAKAVAPPPLPPPVAPVEKPQPRAAKGSTSEIVKQVVPEAQRKAKNSIRGKVTVSVKVKVDPSGAVQEATLDSPETSKYFGGIALQAARQWRFRPANAEQEWMVRFDFSRTATKVHPVKVSP